MAIKINDTNRIGINELNNKIETKAEIEVHEYDFSETLGIGAIYIPEGLTYVDNTGYITGFYNANEETSWEGIFNCIFNLTRITYEDVDIMYGTVTYMDGTEIKTENIYDYAYTDSSTGMSGYIIAVLFSTANKTTTIRYNKQNDIQTLNKKDNTEIIQKLEAKLKEKEEELDGNTDWKQKIFKL